MGAPRSREETCVVVPFHLALAGSLALALTLSVTSTTGSAAPTQPADQADPGPPKNATAVGRGGAVASVDPNASRVGLRVLKNGGNAVDAAVATAAALGVTEPYSAGIGGGGYFVYYDAKSGQVHTIDGRETAPRSDAERRVHRPRDRAALPPSRRSWSPAACPSACPAPRPPGTAALDRWGTQSLRQGARAGDPTGRARFRRRRDLPRQTEDNEERFAAFTSTSDAIPARRRCPRSARRFRNPRPGPHLPRDRAEGRAARSTAGSSPARSSTHVQAPAASPTAPRCRCRRGS